ncbi:heavy-metal-associated domain-containing protein [Brevibacterium sp.]|uniref:heavy-metal-associated domain-containing protein n=1 Tax=Brevibacterium sp. TaxID=1701 RepID=UPI0025BD19A3|nr:heavy-metal-associated domain-containing protein [Brevibacterium sp.]
MKAPVRLGLYGLVLVAVFAVAAFTAHAVVPEDTVRAWAEESAEGGHAAGGEHTGGQAMTDDDAHAGHEAGGAASPGLGLEQDGYRLTGVTAPAEAGEAGELALTVTGPDGSPVTDYEPEHEKELHLIVVRSDGQHFRHVHPERDEDGTWSIPWEWEAAGSYRVFTDFVPGGAEEGLTLSTTVQVAGDVAPAPAKGAVTETEVDGYTVSVAGDLVAGESSELTMTVTREGEPVTALEPYLGAFGHLVALRDGDLAYLHVHPHGDAPEPGETSGPEIVFEANAPTEGRYLLYLDFQVDGQVHTAPLVLDTATAGEAPAKSTPAQDETTQHGSTQDETEHEEGSGHEHG